jgi:hypothetical protein
VGDPKTTILMRKYDGTIVIKPQKKCNPRLSAWLSVFKPSTWFSASQFGRPWNCYEALSLDGPQVDPTMQLYPLAPQGAMRLGQLGQLMSRHPPRCKTMIRSFCDRIIPEVCGYIGAPNKWSLGSKVNQEFGLALAMDFRDVKRSSRKARKVYLWSVLVGRSGGPNSQQKTTKKTRLSSHESLSG